MKRVWPVRVLDREPAAASRRGAPRPESLTRLSPVQGRQADPGF